VRVKWGERWSGGAGPAEQCAPMSRAQLRREIPGDGGLNTAYHGEHRIRAGVAVLRARRSRRRRALAAAMAYSGEAERRARVELAALM
jgi:hypothetical protein